MDAMTRDAVLEIGIQARAGTITIASMLWNRVVEAARSEKQEARREVIVCDVCHDPIGVHGWMRSPWSSVGPRALCETDMVTYMRAVMLRGAG